MNFDHYRLIFQTSSLGIVTTTTDGRFLDANPAFCRMLGYTLEELQHLNIGDLTHPDDRQDSLAARRQVLSGLVRGEILEKRYIHKGGAVVWARLVGEPLRDGQQGVTGLFAMIEDVTQRKQDEAELARMQQAIARSEERLGYITRATLDLFFDWDIAGRQLWWGEGLQRLFGFDAGMMGNDEKFWLRRAHPDDRPHMIAAFTAMQAGEINEWTLRLRIRRMDGHYTPVEERALAIRAADGTLLRVVGGVSDLSARLELEERLRQSQRLEAVGQLTGGVAHDFNNLLTVMLGNAELLKERLAGQPDLLDLAAAVERSALQGADLTRRLLAFARRQALEPRNININQLMDNMVRLLRRTLGEHISLQSYQQSGLWLCAVDANQLEAAILNLALNARDAMPEGGELVIETGNVTLDTLYTRQHFDLAPGDYVCLALSDNGSGIAPEIIGRVLEPFFTTKPKGKGTGLGLSTIYGFIKQSRGHMTLYSEAGHGTTVKLYLPRASADAREDLPPPRETQLQRARTGESVLVVEDDEAVRQYASLQLRSLGYDVQQAGSGHEALALLAQQHHITLLFTDVVMPGGMGGRQLAELACNQYPGLKVLYTSGYTENSIVHNGRLDPGVHLLGKPYRREELAAKVRAVLDE